MKIVMIALAIVGSASSAFAAAECPQGTQKQYACTSTPAEGDSVPADEMLETIAVCADGKKIVLAAEYKGKPESAEVHEVINGIGGVSYMLYHPAVTVSFSLPVALPPSVKQVRGTLVRDIKDVGPESATYTCDIVQ